MRNQAITAHDFRRWNRLDADERRFLDEYVIDHNIVAAVARSDFAGPTEARVTLSKPCARVYVEATMDKIHASRAGKVTVERVISELAAVGFANLGDFFKPGYDGDPFVDFSALTREQTAALQEITVDDYVDGRGENTRSVKKIKFKLHDKPDALHKLLAYALMMRQDQDDIEVPFTVNFQGAAAGRIADQRALPEAPSDDPLPASVDVPEAVGGDL